MWAASGLGCAQALGLTFRAPVRFLRISDVVRCQALTVSIVCSDKILIQLLKYSLLPTMKEYIREQPSTKLPDPEVIQFCVSIFKCPGSCFRGWRRSAVPEDFHRVTEGGSTEDSSQYYCDKVGGRGGSGAVAKAGLPGRASCGAALGS